jgi:hypothetical protein
MRLVRLDFESDVLVAWRRLSKDSNAFFKNSEVVLTSMIQAKLILYELVSLKRIMSHSENQ